MGGCIDGLVGESVDRWVGERMDVGWVREWLDEKMAGWVGAWIDVWVSERVDRWGGGSGRWMGERMDE